MTLLDVECLAVDTTIHTAVADAEQWSQTAAIVLKTAQ